MTRSTSGAVGIGALAIGDIRYKAQHQLLVQMRQSEQPLHWHFEHALDLARSKFTLWEGGIRVPFILPRPGDPHAGETWDEPISTLDVLPTCLEAAGIELPEGLDGR